MSYILNKYKTDITKLFGIGVDVLNGTRSLKIISVDLKLLAINGIVQAAKIGSNQGQSLITLSAFLSDLPQQIAPELRELEKLAAHLSRQITIASISVRRFIQYSITLAKTIDEVFKEAGSNFSSTDFNLLDENELRRLQKNDIIQDTLPIKKKNIIILCNKNIEIMKAVNQNLFEVHSSMAKARKKIETVGRNGFIANYMGSNISIESAFLPKNMRSFSSLVNNIKAIIDNLDSSLNNILDKITEGDTLIKSFIKLRN